MSNNSEINDEINTGLFVGGRQGPLLALGTISGLGICSFICVFLGTGWAHISRFFDPVSFLMIVGLTLGVLLIAHGVFPVWYFPVWVIKLLFINGTDKSLSNAKLRLLWNISGTAIFAVVASGLLGTFIGMVNMLSQGMGDPSVLCSGMAVALLTVFNSVVFLFPFMAIRSRVRQEFDFRKEPLDFHGKFIDKSRGVIVAFAVFSLFYACFGFLVLLFSIQGLLISTGGDNVVHEIRLKNKDYEKRIDNRKENLQKDMK